MLPGLIFCLLITAVGSVPLILVGRTAMRRRRALATWTSATARLVGIADRSKTPLDVALSRGRVHALGVYEYEVAGRTYEGYVPIDGPWRAGEQRTVPIVIDPNDPSRSLEARPIAPSLVGATAALAVAILLVGLLVGSALALRFSR